MIFMYLTLSGPQASAFDAFYWAVESYMLLYQFTGNEKWDRARNATLTLMKMATVVDNTLSYFAREARVGKPLGLGTQVMTMDAVGKQLPAALQKRLRAILPALYLDY